MHDLEHAGPWTIGDAVRKTGLCADTIRAADDELLPARTSRGVRLYAPRVVLAWSAKRAAARDAAAAAKAHKAADR